MHDSKPLEVVQPLRQTPPPPRRIAHHLVHGAKHTAELVLWAAAGAGAAMMLLAVLERVLQ